MTTVYPVKELHMPMPWGHIAAKAWGFPNDKHVLAVHGLLDNAGTFDRLIPLLPPGYYVVCIDLPGHGLSSHFPAGVSLEYFDCALAISRILDFLSWTTCIYIGHSFGGTLGLFYSGVYPRRIERLIGLDSDDIPLVKTVQLIDRIRYIQDYVMKTESNVKERLYTHEEVMYSLMYARWQTLNVSGAEAVMKRSVTRVGDKYKWNHDSRLNIGLWPSFDYDQTSAICEKFGTPSLIILSTATSPTFQGNQLVKLSTDLTVSHKKLKFVTVEGNHNVHINHPERIVPLICKYLSNLKSSL